MCLLYHFCFRFHRWSRCGEYANTPRLVPRWSRVLKWWVACAKWRLILQVGIFWVYYHEYVIVWVKWVDVFSLGWIDMWIRASELIVRTLYLSYSQNITNEIDHSTLYSLKQWSYFNEMKCNRKQFIHLSKPTWKKNPANKKICTFPLNSMNDNSNAHAEHPGWVGI